MKFKLVFITAIFWLFISSYTFGEVISSNEVEEIIVTASHTPLHVDKVGSSYTVITQEQIQKRQAVFVTELLRDVPGFAVSANGVKGSLTQVRVRGAEANQLLVLIDGIEANDVAGSDEFDFAHLLTTNIERIEIIRGPQSALYGSDAIAGVINIITKKGSGPTSVNGFVEGGSFGTFHAGAGASGSGKTYHFNVDGSYLNSSGSNIAKQGNEDDGYENGTLSFTAGYEPFADLKFNVTGRHTEATNETDTQDFIVTGFAVDANTESEINRDYFRGQAKLTLFDNAWEHIVGAAITSTDNVNFTDDVKGSSQTGKKTRFDYQTNLFFDTVNFVNASHIITFAIDHEKDFFRQKDTEFGGLSNQKRNSKTTGIVAGYSIDLWRRLFLSASIRHDNNSDFKDSTTHRSTVAYKISDWGTRIHASYGTGVKRPTFIDRFGFFPGAFFFIGNPDLKPEKSKEWDVGVNQNFWNNRANIGITYFRARLEEEIALVGFPSTPINLTGPSKRQGVEVTTDANLTENLNMSASYTWLDATQANITTGIQTVEIRRPRNVASVNLDYLFLDDRANINLNINHTGTQKDINFATGQRVTLSSYTLINLAASYLITDNFSLYGKIENLLDEDYEDVFGFQTTGIAGYMGIKFNFNPILE